MKLINSKIFERSLPYFASGLVIGLTVAAPLLAFRCAQWGILGGLTLFGFKSLEEEVGPRFGARKMRDRILTLHEWVLLALYDKDALTFRGATALFLQFLGLAGVVLTLKLVGIPLTVEVSNDHPIACFDNRYLQLRYSTAFRPFDSSASQQLPPSLLQAYRKSRTPNSIVITSVQFGPGVSYFDTDRVYAERDGLVLCWFQPASNPESSTCSRRLLLAPHRAQFATMPTTDAEALVQRETNARATSFSGESQEIAGICEAPATDAELLQKLGPEFEWPKWVSGVADFQGVKPSIGSTTLERVVDSIARADAGVSERVAALDALEERDVANILVVRNSNETELRSVSLAVDGAARPRILGGTLKLEARGARLESPRFELAPGESKWAVVVTRRYAISDSQISTIVGDPRFVPLRLVVMSLLIVFSAFFILMFENATIREPRSKWLIGDPVRRLRRLMVRRRALR